LDRSSSTISKTSSISQAAIPSSGQNATNVMRIEVKRRKRIMIASKDFFYIFWFKEQTSGFNKEKFFTNEVKKIYHRL
jgi:hypothetical protein